MTLFCQIYYFSTNYAKFYVLKIKFWLKYLILGIYFEFCYSVGIPFCHSEGISLSRFVAFCHSEGISLSRLLLRFCRVLSFRRNLVVAFAVAFLSRFVIQKESRRRVLSRFVAFCHSEGISLSRFLSRFCRVLSFSRNLVVAFAVAFLSRFVIQ